MTALATPPPKNRRENPPKATRTGRASKAEYVKEKPSYLSTGILILGALYCLFPVIWVVAAASKDGTELFSTFTLAPSTHLWDNIVELTEYRDGLFWRWMLNTALYAGGSEPLCPPGYPPSPAMFWRSLIFRASPVSSRSC